MNISSISYDGPTGGALPTLQYVRAVNVPNIFVSKGYTYLPINNRTLFVATSCKLDLCAQLVDIHVRDAAYTENLKQIFCDGTYPRTSDVYSRYDNRTQYRLSPPWKSKDLDGSSHLTVSVWSHLAVVQFLTGLFDGYSVLSTGYGPTIALNPTESKYYATVDVLQAMYSGDMSRCVPGEDHLVCAATSVTKALTKSLRDSEYVTHGAGRPIRNGLTNGIVAAGDTNIVAIFVRINWWWLTLPVLVWALGAVTLLGTVLKSRQADVPGWRDSLLPLLLLYRDSDGTGDLPADFRANRSWDEWAEKVKVGLSVRKEFAALE